ncbi:MAG: 8-oxo-dGTP pyrophosphatase MutT (NUDIX family) [Saprospiraceae bacterium]|jgi:8-oxo-dGTP pyrophosphatase MutT (NUDIX family)
MYKIYYNDTVIRLAHMGYESHITRKAHHQVIIYYTGKTKHILSCLDKIEKDPELKELVLLTTDVKLLKRDFFSVFKIVPAAGGLVLNDKCQMLMIFRRGHWDLPKGKMEEGETKKETAIREVQEETGLSNISLLNKLVTTYHIYRGRNSDRRILKPSYWYLMYSNERKLIPQTKEDIEKAEWINYREEVDDLKPIYTNIVAVVRAYRNRLQ